MSHLTESCSSLCHRVGWPHTQEEWEAMLAVGTPFTAQRGDSVYGSVLLTCYPDMASIGMLLVDEPFRRLGTGTALTRASLRQARQKDIERITVVSSHVAKNIYIQAGFRRLGAILVMGRAATAQDAPSKDSPVEILRAPDPSLQEALITAAYDGCAGRRTVLQAFLSQKNGVCAALHDGGRLKGFAGSVLRLPPGKPALRAIGPLWAEDPAQVGALVGAIGRETKTALTCFLYQGVEGETQATRDNRHRAAESLRHIGFETRDSLPLFSYKGRPLPPCTKASLLSPISLALG